MKSFIPHTLIVISDFARMSLDDPAMNECYRLSFDWANDMGRNGKTVYGLSLERPYPENDDPLRKQLHLCCKIECTKRERQIWEEMQELEGKKFVLEMLKEDN